MTGSNLRSWTVALLGGLAFALAAAPPGVPSAARAAEAPAAVGEVVRLHRELTATTLQTRRTLARGGSVHAGETLRTGPGARARVALRDSVALTLGDGAVVALDESILGGTGADGAANPAAAAATLLHGALRLASGALAADASVRVATPIATLGVRGTELWAYQEGGTLSVVLIDDGRVEVATEGGTIVLDAPREGIVIDDPSAAMPESPQRWDQGRIDRALESVAWPAAQ